MAMSLLVLINLRWSATTAIIGDTLLGSAELQETKRTGTRKAQEGAKEGPNYALMAYSSSSSYSENESAYVEKINGLKWDIQVGEIAIGELRKKLEIVQKEKDGIQFNVDKFENASKSLNKIIESQIVDNYKKEEFINEPVVIKPVVENSEAKSSEAKPKAVRKNNGALIIEIWVLDSEEENRVNTVKDKNVNAARPKAVVNASRPKAVVNAIQGNNVNVVKASACWVKPQMDLQDKGVIDSGCSRHMTGNMSYLTNYKEIDGGYVSFGGTKTGNITEKGNLVRGLPSKLFENDQTCVACQKGKQHRASSTKDETSGILKSFITGIENLVDHKVKVIRCDNGTEFKNKEMNQFCEMKGILRQYSVARTPQQNRVAERRNRTLIEAARTMLADSKLPTTFWAEAVNTACYVQNRVLVVKPHNKTPYELFHGRTPTLSFMRPFGCLVTILNTIDHLGKFDGKADEGFFVGYSLNSKAFRVFNSRTRIVEENLHIRFSESTPNVVGSGPDWLFDIDALTRTMNYEPIVAGTQSNGFAGTKASDNAGQARKETEPVKDYILLPLWTADPPFSQNPKSSDDDGFKPSSDVEKKVNEDPRKESECNDQEKEDNVNNTNNVNTVSSTVNAAGTNEDNAELLVDPNMPALEDYSIFDLSSDDQEDGAEADMNNLDTTIQVSPIPTTRIHKDHPLNQVIGDLQSATQTRNMSKNLEEYGFVSTTLKQRTNHKDLQNCLFACFLSQEEPKKIKEEVYVYQPPRFEDPDFLDRVYKVEKHCMDYIKLLELGDILLVQVYVDDIIFGSTKKELCIAFEKLMHEKF
ncbi:retrovirus-related pol polyprotein from transposon TNT 1-94 [Tanacetum coccineum]